MARQRPGNENNLSKHSMGEGRGEGERRIRRLSSTFVLAIFSRTYSRSEITLSSCPLYDPFVEKVWSLSLGILLVPFLDPSLTLPGIGKEKQKEE